MIINKGISMEDSTIIKLKHEYGATCNFSLTDNIDNNSILIPLPIDIVNEAVYNAFFEFKKENENELNIMLSNQNKTNYQMIINLNNLKNKTPNLSFDEISDNVSNNINLKIQNNIIKLLKNNNLNFKDYDRSRVFFEFSVTNGIMTIIWIKHFNFQKKDEQ